MEDRLKPRVAGGAAAAWMLQVALATMSLVALLLTGSKRGWI